MGLIMQDESGEYIPIELVESHFNVRTDSDVELNITMQQILQVGVEQAIEVVQREKYFEVVFGNRRLTAMKKLGWTKLYIGKHVKINPDNLTDFQIIQRHMIENLGRVDIHELEIGAMALKAHKKYNQSYESIALSWGNKFNAKQLKEWALTAEKTDPTLPVNQDEDSSKRPTLTMTIIMTIQRRFPKHLWPKMNRAAMTEKLTVREIDLISILYHGGLPIDDAIAEIHDFSMVQFTFPLRNSIRRQLEAQYGKTINQIILEAIKYGKIKLPRDLIFLEALKLASQKRKRRKDTEEEQK